MATMLEATYKVVTPLFCAGAHSDRAELRLSSFKGVLRFWWRALAWPRCGGDLRAIKRREDALFGSAQTGQSRVLMRLVADGKPATVSKEEVLTVAAGNKTVVGEGARYLGYGVMEAFSSAKSNKRAGELKRACLRAPFEFAVEIRTRHLDREGLDSLTNALIAVGTLGGLGAKSRKGYGSLALRSLRVDGNGAWTAPGTVDDLRGAIAGLYPQDTPVGLPGFSALCEETRHVLLSSGERLPLELLDLVGRELVRFRSWGRGEKILGGGVDSEKRFKDDHDLMKAPAGQRQSHPRRIAFGLPHNYGKPADQQVGPHDNRLDRRASPLFIHIHECGTKPVAVLSFLPARFLPVDKYGKSYISVGGTKIEQKPEEELYQLIRDFLDRLLDANRRREPFTDAVEAK